MTTREVVLDGGSPWGFRLHGGVDVGQPLRISRVNPGSKAAYRGVREGDLITSINGQSTKELTNSEAHSLLKQSGDVLRLGLNENNEYYPQSPQCTTSNRRRNYRTIHEETHSETVKKESSTTLTSKTTKFLTSSASGSVELAEGDNDDKRADGKSTSGEHNKENLIGEDNHRRETASRPYLREENRHYSKEVSPRSTLSSDSNYSSPSGHSFLTTTEEGAAAGMPSKRRRRSRHNQQQHKNNGAQIVTSSSEYRIESPPSPPDLSLTDTTGSSGNMKKKSPSPMRKSRSLDDDNQTLQIQEVTTVAEVVCDSPQGEPIVTEVEDPKLSPEEESGLRNFLEGLNLVSGPDVQEVPSPKNDGKHQKKMALVEYFTPIAQNPRYLDVICEENSGELSSTEDVTRQQHLKQGTPELDAQILTGTRSRSRRRRVGRNDNAQRAILVGAKIVDTATVATSTVVVKEVPEVESSEVVFLSDCSSDGSRSLSDNEGDISSSEISERVQIDVETKPDQQDHAMISTIEDQAKLHQLGHIEQEEKARTAREVKLAWLEDPGSRSSQATPESKPDQHDLVRVDTEPGDEVKPDQDDHVINQDETEEKPIARAAREVKLAWLEDSLPGSKSSQVTPEIKTSRDIHFADSDIKRAELQQDQLNEINVQEVKTSPKSSGREIIKNRREQSSVSELSAERKVDELEPVQDTTIIDEEVKRVEDTKSSSIPSLAGSRIGVTDLQKPVQEEIKIKESEIMEVSSKTSLIKKETRVIDSSNNKECTKPEVPKPKDNQDLELGLSQEQLETINPTKASPLIDEIKVDPQSHNPGQGNVIRDIQDQQHKEIKQYSSSHKQVILSESLNSFTVFPKLNEIKVDPKDCNKNPATDTQHLGSKSSQVQDQASVTKQTEVAPRIHEIKINLATDQRNAKDNQDQQTTGIKGLGLSQKPNIVTETLITSKVSHDEINGDPRNHTVESKSSQGQDQINLLKQTELPPKVHEVKIDVEKSDKSSSKAEIKKTLLESSKEVHVTQSSNTSNHKAVKPEVPPRPHQIKVDPNRNKPIFRQDQQKINTTKEEKSESRVHKVIINLEDSNPNRTKDKPVQSQDTRQYHEIKKSSLESSSNRKESHVSQSSSTIQPKVHEIKIERESPNQNQTIDPQSRSNDPLGVNSGLKSKEVKPEVTDRVHKIVVESSNQNKSVDKPDQRQVSPQSQETKQTSLKTSSSHMESHSLNSTLKVKPEVPSKVHEIKIERESSNQNQTIDPQSRSNDPLGENSGLKSKEVKPEVTERVHKIVVESSNQNKSVDKQDQRQVSQQSQETKQTSLKTSSSHMESHSLNSTLKVKPEVPSKVHEIKVEIEDPQKFTSSPIRTNPDLNQDQQTSMEHLTINSLKDFTRKRFSEVQDNLRKNQDKLDQLQQEIKRAQLESMWRDKQGSQKVNKESPRVHEIKVELEAAKGKTQSSDGIKVHHVKIELEDAKPGSKSSQPDPVKVHHIKIDVEKPTIKDPRIPVKPDRSEIKPRVHEIKVNLEGSGNNQQIKQSSISSHYSKVKPQVPPRVHRIRVELDANTPEVPRINVERGAKVQIKEAEPVHLINELTPPPTPEARTAPISPTPSSDSDSCHSSRSTSKSTVRARNYDPNSSLGDVTSLQDGCPTLRELCLDYLMSQPFGLDILQELADVSSTIGRLCEEDKVDVTDVPENKMAEGWKVRNEADSSTRNANSSRLLEIITSESDSGSVNSDLRGRAADLSEWLHLARSRNSPRERQEEVAGERERKSASLATPDRYQRQMQTLLEKERDIQRELEQLEDEKRKLAADMAPSRFKMEDYRISRRGDYAEEKRKEFVGPGEFFRQQMYEEYVRQVAEREERRQMKIVKVSGGGPSVDAARRDPDPDPTREFMDRVRAKRESGKLAGDSEDAVQDMEDCVPRHLREFVEITKESEGDDVSLRFSEEELIFNKDGVWSPGQKRPDSQQKPHHPLPSGTATATTDHDQENDPITPIWTPKSATSSPTVDRKEFRPIRFDSSPVLSRKSTPGVRFDFDQVDRTSSGDIAGGRSGLTSEDPSAGASLQKRIPTSHSSPGELSKSSGASRLPRAQNPTITLLQKAREGQLPRGASYIDQQPSEPLKRPHTINGRPQAMVNPVYQIKHDYTSESDSERPRKMVDLGPRKYEGVGPTTKDGMPLILRSEVKDANQSKWYKKMYDTIHKQKPHRDEYVTVRYKQRKGHQYPYSGYLSEPEPGAYDSDYTDYKYATLDRRRAPMMRDFWGNKENNYSSSSLYNQPQQQHSMSSSSTLPLARNGGTSNYEIRSSASATDVLGGPKLRNGVQSQPKEHLYLKNPGRIENYRPGHSSISEKEAKEWWDEVMDIFDGWLDDNSPLPSYDIMFQRALARSHLEQQSQQRRTIIPPRSFMNQALKESGYESDSTLVFRRRDDTAQQLSPLEQREAYKVIQKGGDVPLHGLRKPAPERPKDGERLEYIPLTPTLTRVRVHRKKMAAIRPQTEILCYPVTIHPHPSTLVSKYVTKKASDVKVTAKVKAPSPPRRRSSRNNSTLRLMSNVTVKKTAPAATPARRHHEGCFSSNKAVLVNKPSVYSPKRAVVAPVVKSRVGTPVKKVEVSTVGRAAKRTVTPTTVKKAVKPATIVRQIKAAKVVPLSKSPPAPVTRTATVKSLTHRPDSAALSAMKVYLDYVKPVSDSKFRTCDTRSRSVSPSKSVTWEDSKRRSTSAPKMMIFSQTRRPRVESPQPRIRSPSSRRIEQRRASPRPMVDDDWSIYSCPSLAHSTSSLGSTESDFVRRLVSSKFRDLNDFYSAIERFGQLESRCVRYFDQKVPRRRCERDEIIDYDRWQEVRRRERAEREMDLVLAQLRSHERDKGFLFCPSLRRFKVWRRDSERSLRVREKSVGDIRSEFERLGLFRREASANSDIYTPLWRPDSVADIASRIDGRSVSSDCSAMLTRGVGSRLWSSLSVEQVNLLRDQLEEIYRSDDCTIRVPSSGVVGVRQLSVRRNSDLSEDQKKVMSRSIGREVIDRFGGCAGYGTVRPKETRGAIAVAPRPVKAAVKTDATVVVAQTQSDGTASTDESTRTVIDTHENAAPTKESIKDKVDYFESVVSTVEPYTPTIHKPSDDHLPATPTPSSPSPASSKSQSCQNLRELFGELTASRSRSLSPRKRPRGEVKRLAHHFETSPLSRSASDPSVTRLVSRHESRRGRARGGGAVSPAPMRASDRLMPHINVISKIARLATPPGAAFRAAAGRSRSVEEMADAFGCPAGEVERLRRRFDRSSRDGEGVSPLGRAFTSAPDVKELRDVGPYLAASWIAHRFPRREDNARAPGGSPEGSTGSRDTASRLRVGGRSKSASPTSRQRKSGGVKKEGSKRKRTGMGGTGNKRDSRYYDRKYEGQRWWKSDVCRPSVSFKDEEVTSSGMVPPAPPPKSHYELRNPPPPPPPPPQESPRKYVENEVTIHYKTPVRQEIKEYLSEDELAYRQAEAMKKIYQEERRRKYLQVSQSLQELQDLTSRRHTDNFIPSQKSPISLNRYDDFDDLVPPPAGGWSSSLGRRQAKSPEPRLLARALYNFVGQTARELTFRKGDLIYVRRQVDKNWYEGELNAMVGLFPVNYVEIVTYDTPKTPAAAAAATPRKPHEGQARAKYNFVAQSHLELSLGKGELVVVTRRVDDNWYEGKIGGRRGIFPVAYVDVLIDPGAPPPPGKPVAAPAAHSLLLNGSAGGKESMGAHSYTPPVGGAATGGFHHAKPVQVIGGGGSRQALHVDTQSEPVPFRALYKYLPQNDDELELLEGDTVYVLEKCDDGWYVGSSDRTGAFGTFPGNYVEKV